MFGHLSAITAHVGPPTYPAPMQQIFDMPMLPLESKLFVFVFVSLSLSHSLSVCVFNVEKSIS